LSGGDLADAHGFAGFAFLRRTAFVRLNSRRRHRPHETISVALDGANEPLIFAVVPNGTADSGYSTAESRLGNDATPPDAGEQVVVADDAMAIANEMKKDVEDLRFDADGDDAAPKLPSLFVKEVLVERVDAHEKRPWGGRDWSTISTKNQDALKAREPMPVYAFRELATGEKMMDAHLALQSLARIAAACSAGFALASAQSQDLAADAAVTVFAQRYVVTGLAIDDLNVLERYLLDLQPQSVTLYMCGMSGRATRAAAHRFRQLPLRWLVLEDDAEACSATRVLPVAAAVRSGQAPFGINDEDVDRYWRETMQP